VSDESDEEPDNALYADHRNFYKVEKWKKDGMKVDRLLYAGNSLEKARQRFDDAAKHWPRNSWQAGSGPASCGSDLLEACWAARFDETCAIPHKGLFSRVSRRRSWFFLTLFAGRTWQWEWGSVILTRPCWECALREFLEGFTAGMTMLGAMLVLTALADKLL
jgi:hypothetical protein